MIQRIQSVYLLFAALLLTAAFFFPLIVFDNQGQTFLEVYLKGFRDSSSPLTGLNVMMLLPLQIITAVSVVLAFSAIFLYKNRRSQLRFVKFGIVLLLVEIALIFFYYSNLIGAATNAAPDYNHPAMYLILAALILYVLANRSIASDEKLVKAADRLR